MKKLYEQSPEMQLSGKCQLRHVKCTHHKGYLMEDLSMIKSGFYEISFCKSGDFLFRIGQKRHFITNGDILVIPPDIPHYFTSSDLVANYYDFITVWLEKSYISNLKSHNYSDVAGVEETPAAAAASAAAASAARRAFSSASLINES